MGLQNLLLGLGTALVAVAVVVFTAVNWSQLDASIQGLILVGLTIAAGAGAAIAARRSMPSTAEAVGTVAVLLALADVHALRVGLAPAAAVSLFWAGGLVVVAALAATLGRSNAIRAPQIAAGLLAQGPLYCVLQAADATVWAAQLAVVAQAFVVLVLADRVDGPRWARRAAAGWALVVAFLLTGATVFDSVFGELLHDDGADLHRTATGLCLAAAAVLAAFVAWLRAESGEVRPMALFGATSLALAAVWFATIDAVGGSTAVGLVALAASLVVLAFRPAPKEWGEAPVMTAGLIGGASVLPLLGATASMLIAASTVSSQAWLQSGSLIAADFQLADAPSSDSVALGLQLAAVAIGVWALLRRSSKVAAGTAAVVALAGLTIAPLLVPITIATTVLLALGAVAIGLGSAVMLGGRSEGFPVALGFSVLAYAWATPWSLATPGLTFATLAVGLAGASTVAVVARRAGAVQAAGAASAWLVVGTTLLTGLVAWDAGSSTAMSWALASVVAAVLSIAGVVLLDPKGTAPQVARVMRQAVEASALVVYLGALMVTVSSGDPGSVSVALAAGVIGFGLHAVRPERTLAGLAAAGELLALIWLQLRQAEVVLVEAYTLPLAAVLLAVGLASVRLHRGDRGEPHSWVTYGPALVVGLAPTVWLAFTESGSIRPLVGLVAGALVLVGGVARGKRALVDVGTATVVVLGLLQLAPIVGEIPNWATIGATGVVLIVVGATFEQRRRDLKAVLRSYAALT